MNRRKAIEVQALDRLFRRAPVYRLDLRQVTSASLPDHEVADPKTILVDLGQGYQGIVGTHQTPFAQDTRSASG
jgi:hypothetical protein